MIKTAMPKEVFNTYSHMIGAIISYIMAIILVVNTTGGVLNQFIALIFGLCAGLVMTFSATYHAKKQQDDEISFWRKVDHCAIFLMLGGTFTPIGYFFLDEPIKWIFLALLWVLIVGGILFKVKFMHAPRWQSVLVFLGIGLTALPALPSTLKGLRNIDPIMPIIFWLAIASIIIGLSIYASKKPNPKPETFGFHGIWHIMVIITFVFLFILMFGIFT